jgi:hypothetical protein
MFGIADPGVIKNIVKISKFFKINLNRVETNAVAKYWLVGMLSFYDLLV